MPRLGDEQLHVGVGDVAGQVLAPPRVVEPDDARSDETRPADRDHVVGRVVEEHADVRWPVGAQPRTEHRREPDARLVELAVGDDEVPELEQGTARDRRVVGVTLREAPSHWQREEAPDPAVAPCATRRSTSGESVPGARSPPRSMTTVSG